MEIRKVTLTGTLKGSQMEKLMRMDLSLVIQKDFLKVRVRMRVRVKETQMDSLKVRLMTKDLNLGTLREILMEILTTRGRQKDFQMQTPELLQ